MFFFNPSRFDRFFGLAYSLGLDFADDGRAVLPLDVDGDGDLDLATLGLQGLRLLENRLARDGRHFARVRLRATRTYAGALGAQVALVAGGVRQQDYVKATAGFQTQVPLDLHFGLGDATRIDRIEVRWPSGTAEVHDDLPSDRLLAITEGEPPEVRRLPAWPADRPVPLEAYDVFAPARTVEGGEAPLARPGTPAVVNFWSPSCKPCEAELPVLRALHGELGDRVAFAGVSVETRDEAGVRRAIARQRLGYTQFLAGDAMLVSFFGSDGVAPVPSTFVFDARGALRRTFHRAVSREDLAPLLESLLDDRPVASYLVGLAYDAAVRGDYAEARARYDEVLATEPNHAMATLGLATVAYEEGRLDESIRLLLDATRRDPWLRRAWEVLAVCYAVQGREKDAVDSCRRAMEMAPQSNCLARIATPLAGVSKAPGR